MAAIGVLGGVAPPRAGATGSSVPTVSCSTNSKIFDTGYDVGASGTLATGTTDTYWQVAGGFAGYDYPTGTSPAGKVSLPTSTDTFTASKVYHVDGAPVVSTTSKWIAASGITNGSNQKDTAGKNPTKADWYFEYSFDLTSQVDKTTFALDMNWMADNDVAAVWVNTTQQTGTDLPQTATDPYTYDGFSTANKAATVLSTGWKAGLNTIVVQIKSGSPFVGFDASVTQSALCPTVSVKQSIGSRIEAGDQFEASVKSSGGTVIASATTSGTEMSATSSAAHVSVGTTYTIYEAVTSGSPDSLSDYDASIACTDTTTSKSVTPGGSAPHWTLKISTAHNYSCDITETPYAVDMMVSVTASPSSYSAGQTLKYTITATNDGTGTVTGATVKDTLPTALSGAGFTWTCAPSSASCTGSGSGDITDTVTLSSGGKVVYTLTGTVPDETTGTLDDTATVTPPHGSDDPGCTPDCSATTSSTVAPHRRALTHVDLSGTVSVAPRPYVGDEQLTYTIDVSNSGPASAVGVTLADPLPAALDGAGFTWTCTPSAGASCTGSGSGDIADTVTVPVDGRVVYDVQGTVPLAMTGTLTDVLTISAPGSEIDTGCTPSCSVTAVDPSVTPAPALELVQHATLEPRPVESVADRPGSASRDSDASQVGDAIVFTYTVTNVGNVALTGVSVTDPLVGAVSCPESTLTPGASELCTAENLYLVTATDAALGMVQNSATALADDSVAVSAVAVASSLTSTTVVLDAATPMPVTPAATASSGPVATAPEQPLSAITTDRGRWVPGVGSSELEFGLGLSLLAVGAAGGIGLLVRRRRRPAGGR
ncbi:MAG: DUF7507 domain-containing protein [Acidimicrobiales bacterium]